MDYIINFLAGGVLHLTWWQVALVTLLLTHITIISVTVFLHRSQAHRGLDLHPAVMHFFRFWLWLTTGMITKEWVAIHRKHHARCEREGDPHSPVVFGLGMVFFRGAELYRLEGKNEETLKRFGHGTPDDWMERNVYTRHSLLGILIMLGIDIALFGVLGLTVWAIQMAWIPFWAAGVVNGLGHWWGYRNFETTDTATNLSPWGVWIGGEELHNNHHAFPSSAKFALRRWEVDIGWAAIKGMEKLGLAKVLRVAPSLDVRPNINVPDTDTVRALLAHRFLAMTEYQRKVLKPALREEARLAGEKMRSLLPRKLRKGLADDGRWLSPESRAQLDQWVQQRPRIRTLIEYRAALREVLEARGHDASERLQRLQAWCQEAEASGIRVLQDYSARLKGYALQNSHA